MKLSTRARKIVALDRDGLVKAGASNVLALDASTLGGTVSLLATAPAQEPAQERIGLVRVEGPIAQRAIEELCAYVDGYDAITHRLQSALADATTLGVLLVIDSPGGDVAGLEEAISRMRAAVTASGKPVVAYVDEFAASAAYWIAAGVADEVHVPQSGRVGSIGCIGAWLDQSEAWKREGVALHVIREPEGKAEAMPAAPVAALADERLAASVKAAAGRFYQAAGDARGLKPAAVRKLNGALFTGAAAVDEKLADHVGTLEGAASRVFELAQERRAKRSSKGSNMHLIAIVAAMCGLSADASPEATEVAFQATTKDLLESTGAKTLAGVVAAVEALKLQNKAHAEKAVKLEAIEKRIEEEGKRAIAAKLEQTLDAAVKAGKVSPVKRADLAEKAAKYGQDWLDALVADLPVQGGTEEGASGAAAATDVATIDAALKTELAKLGLTEDDHRKYGRKAG